LFEDNYAVGHDIVESIIDYKRITQPSGSGSLLTSISDYAKFVEAIMQGRGLEKAKWLTMLSPTVRIHSKQQFPTLLNEKTDKYDSIELSYGLGWGIFTCRYGKAFFKEGHGQGCQNYNVNFIDQKTSIIIMTNSDNGEMIFKDLLEKIIGDTFTPWEWEGYIPYDMIKPKSIGVYLYDLIILESIEKAIEKYKKIKNSPAKKNFIFDEDQLNSLGYQMIKEMKLNDAIKLFKLNLEEYPNSASAYQGMGDAYRKRDQIALAIENYKKSLALNPDNENVKKALKKLKKDPFSLN
jgi:tetratricopeptide (TPR) repeat protein